MPNLRSGDTVTNARLERCWFFLFGNYHVYSAWKHEKSFLEEIILEAFEGVLTYSKEHNFKINVSLLFIDYYIELPTPLYLITNY